MPFTFAGQVRARLRVNDARRLPLLVRAPSTPRPFEGSYFSQSQKTSNLILLLWILRRLDQLIVSTAIPFIVSEFDSLSQVAWIVSSNPLLPPAPSACLLTATFLVAVQRFLHDARRIFVVVLPAAGDFSLQCVLTPPVRSVLSFFNNNKTSSDTLHRSAEWVFISSIFIFEIGSLLCGVAPSMVVLILGSFPASPSSPHAPSDPSPLPLFQGGASLASGVAECSLQRSSRSSRLRR